MNHLSSCARILLGACLVGALLGCSSSSSSSSDGSGGAPDASTNPDGKLSLSVKAAAGGTIKVTGAEVDIPAGALSADTVVTVEAKSKSGFAQADTIMGDVFDFGPDGTKFLAPVTMTLDLQGATVPSGMQANVGYYDGTAWQLLGDSKVTGGAVTATTTHFTPFGIVLTPIVLNCAGGSIVVGAPAGSCTWVQQWYQTNCASFGICSGSTTGDQVAASIAQATAANDDCGCCKIFLGLKADGNKSGSPQCAPMAP